MTATNDKHQRFYYRWTPGSLCANRKGFLSITRIIFTLFLILFLANCNQPFIQKREIVSKGITFAENERFAKNFVNKKRFVQMIDYIKQRFPLYSELFTEENFGLRWEKREYHSFLGKEKKSIVWIVVICKKSKIYPANEVLNTAFDFISSDLSDSIFPEIEKK